MVKDLSKLKLNKEQLQAIKHGKGPLLIIAGAGTGKTTVITERVKYLISSGMAKPEEILALTFTEKAAKEMEERIDVALPYGYTQMWVMTFHSFCDQILRREALHIGLDPTYKLLTQAESTQLFRKNLFNFDLDYFRPLGNPNKFIGGMLQHFSRLQDEDISPSDYIRWVQAQKSKIKSQKDNSKVKTVEYLEIQKWGELSKAYRKYDELKTKEGLMDFGDLITKTLKLFRERKNILREYQEKFKYILIDEFQDTNFAQNELAILLSKSHKNITVVGDDDQSIYRFRGAAVSNIIQFRNQFPNARVVVLTQNYRSSQKILDKSYDLIQFNNPDRLEVVEKIDKKLKALKSYKKSEIHFLHLDRVENEAEEVAKKIKDIRAKEKRNWRDFAILVRANGQAEPFSRAMGRFGIPHQFLGPGRLFKQPEVMDLVSYLKVLSDPEDSTAFFRIISMDFFKINPRDLAMLGSFARKTNISLFEAAEKRKKVSMSKDSRKKLGKILKIIKKHFALFKSETAGQILYYFLEDTGLLLYLLNPEGVEAEKKAKNIAKFFDKLKTYDVDHPESNVGSTVEWLDLSAELGESPLAADSDWTEIDAVNILTVHSSKGLEFPVVFLVNLVAQRFPSMERREQIPIPDGIIKEVLPVGDYHLEEERRLFYVGMTRAKEKLFLTAADYYGEGKRGKKLSPFVFEALGTKAVGSQSSIIGSNKLSYLEFGNGKKPTADNRNPKTVINYLSYSQIESFKICPLHYKLGYIFRLPTPRSSSQSFGSSIHLAIKSFYEDVKRGEKPTKSLMFKNLKSTWVNLGYKDKKHELKFFEKGKIYLEGFLKQTFDPKKLPVLMEEKFQVPLDSKKSLKVGGVMDRVDVLPGGSIEIIDYKTGATIPTQREVDKNLQLSIYALAASSIQSKPFGKTPDKIKLSLYFLDTQEKLSTVRTKEDLKKAEQEILKVRDEIEKSDFKCSRHMFCLSGCEYYSFCSVE